MAGAAGDYEELAGEYGDGTAVRVGATDAEVTAKDEEHFVLVDVDVPGKFTLDLYHFDVLVVLQRGDLTDDSRRLKLRESGTCEFQRDGVLLQHCKEPMRKLVAEACADGDLVTALGATAAEDGGTGLGLHAGEKAVRLGAVAAVRLKGALRHDKKLLRRRLLLLKLLVCCNNL